MIEIRSSYLVCDVCKAAVGPYSDDVAKTARAEFLSSGNWSTNGKTDMCATCRAAAGEFGAHAQSFVKRKGQAK